MILKRLQVERQTYGALKGTFSGNAHFEGQAGDIAVKLTPEHCERIFEVCADAIVSVAKEAARDLTAQCIDQGEALRLSRSGSIDRGG